MQLKLQGNTGAFETLKDDFMQKTQPEEHSKFIKKRDSIRKIDRRGTLSEVQLLHKNLAYNIRKLQYLKKI